MSKRLSLILGVAAAVGFGFGLLRLLALRFEVGDVYPAYSSLRADPLGTMAFRESLGHVPGLKVGIDYSATGRLPDGSDTTYLHLAAPMSAWHWLPEEASGEIQRFLGRGGRFVVTLFPETGSVAGGKNWWTDDEEQSGDSAKKRKKKKRATTEENRQKRRTLVKERWGVELGFIPLAADENGTHQPVLVHRESGAGLPDELDWHSGAIFTNLQPGWQVVYARGTNPVVIERSFGPGKMVMASDSYFVSNEALRGSRETALLAWLVGRSHEIVFDEAHLGLTEQPGVAGLLRKYRLHGLAGALLLLAALFIWKNSTSLVPPPAVESASGLVTGKEAAAGFGNLLRRNVPARDLVAVCWAEWKKSHHQAGPRAAGRIAKAEAALAAASTANAGKRDPVRLYQQISEILKNP